MIFEDSKGNEVNEGDVIKITEHYNYPFLVGQKAVIVWDKYKGMYKYRYTTIRRKKEFITTDTFFGVHSFEKINDSTQ